MSDKSQEFEGTVEWFGENPCIILKDSPADPIKTIGHFFRVTGSAAGSGIVAIVMESPAATSQAEPDANVCITDNRALADYIIDNYAAVFGSFKGTDVKNRLTFKDLKSITIRNEWPQEYAEIVEADGYRVDFVWRDLESPFAATFPPSESGIPGQRMISTLVPSKDGSIIVNGRECAGKVFEQETLGRKHQSSVLAFAETWVREG